MSELSQKFESAPGEARAALEKARNSGADAWQDVEPTVEVAVQKAQKAYDEFTSFVKATAREIQRPEEAQTVEEQTGTTRTKRCICRRISYPGSFLTERM